MIDIALYQPEIAQNLGAIIRIAVCFDVALHIIEPCGFPLDEKRIKRSAMDYIDLAKIIRHDDWEDFLIATKGRRKMLMTTKSSISIVKAKFLKDDILLMGNESSGAPDFVHQTVEGRIKIPLSPQARSFNIACATSIAIFEAKRQIGCFI